MKINPKSEKGFTLVELLASIIVLVAVGSVIAGIITSTLRGTNKTNTVENIRQNGNHAIAQVSENIEYAQVFNGLSIDGGNYVRSCPFSLSPTPVPVATRYRSIKITSNNRSQIVYNCTSSILSANRISLVDTNSVSLTECAIDCIQSRATDVPIIKVSFKLGPKNPNSLPENSTAPVLFETSVTIRNYKR